MTDEKIIKFLLGESSEAENIEIKNWLAADAKHQKYFEEMQLIWDTSKNLDAQHLEDEDLAWEKFKAKADERKAVQSKINRFNWLKIAASLVLVSTSCWFGYQHFKTPEMMTITTATATDTVILPDGSEVKLNKYSTLRYPEQFKGEKREIFLTKGEAFFTVTPNKEKPFIIQTKDITVRVVGTSFNVKCGAEETEVIVATGTVKVNQKNDEISLQPGERVTAHHQNLKLKKEPVPDQLYNYYFTKTFVANGTPLWRVVEVLNEAYAVKIVIENDELKNLQLTSTFKNESLDQILRVLEETFHLQIVKENNLIIIK
ncbi:FecR family protein [Pedobacter arcticus]|uniref:FecR family protein n=1 Tax=Pedobacter arcticus TaxID=752140 RepID=UPI0002D2703C|nr:FecR domain-containing protein [Pedobacter arcticus]